MAILSALFGAGCGGGGAATSALLQTPAQPVAQVAPSNLTFGSQTVGVVSEAQSVTLNNTGDAALSLTSIAVIGANPSDFAQTNNCGSSVAAGGALGNCTGGQKAAEQSR
jgi:hypothetical protein